MKKYLVLPCLIATSFAFSSCNRDELSNNGYDETNEAIGIIEEKIDVATTDNSALSINSQKEKVEKDSEKEDSSIRLTELSKCLNEKGAIMYGTSWCGHCKNQKALFGKTFKNVNYVDCDDEGEKCREAGITGYPTWKIGGEAFPGKRSLEFLAEKTGCSY